MCVRSVVDANAFGHLVHTSRGTAGDQFRSWIERGDGMIVYSNETQYGIELKRVQNAYLLLQHYFQSGKARRIARSEILEAQESIPSPPIRRSDDPHVLALAAAGAATVLMSRDQALCSDFGNTSVLPRIPGAASRRALPLRDRPDDTRGRSLRRQFLNRRRCTSEC